MRSYGSAASPLSARDEASCLHGVHESSPNESLRVGSRKRLRHSNWEAAVALLPDPCLLASGQLRISPTRQTFISPDAMADQLLAQVQDLTEGQIVMRKLDSLTKTF